MSVVYVCVCADAIAQELLKVTEYLPPPPSLSPFLKLQTYSHVQSCLDLHVGSGDLNSSSYACGGKCFSLLRPIFNPLANAKPILLPLLTSLVHCLGLTLSIFIHV